MKKSKIVKINYNPEPVKDNGSKPIGINFNSMSESERKAFIKAWKNLSKNQINTPILNSKDEEE